jgi:hypothetical protein
MPDAVDLERPAHAGEGVWACSAIFPLGHQKSWARRALSHRGLAEWDNRPVARPMIHGTSAGHGTGPDEVRSSQQPPCSRPGKLPFGRPGQKAAKFTADEYQCRQHTEGHRLLSHSGPSCSSDHLLTHHERWDGSGYPKGLLRLSSERTDGSPRGCLVHHHSGYKAAIGLDSAMS